MELKLHHVNFSALFFYTASNAAIELILKPRNLEPKRLYKKYSMKHANSFADKLMSKKSPPRIH